MVVRKEARTPLWGDTTGESWTLLCRPHRGLLTSTNPTSGSGFASTGGYSNVALRAGWRGRWSVCKPIPRSSQAILNRFPLVAVRLQVTLGDGTMQRVPLLGTSAAVLREVGLVMCNQDVLQVLPGENVETVIPILTNPDENHDESPHRARLLLPEHLPRPVKRDVAVQRHVSKLP
jgi:hypothetical protein